MAVRRGIYLVALVSCLVFYVFYREWMAAVVLLTVLLLPVFSLLVSLPAMMSVRVKLKCPRVVTMGEQAEVCLRAESRFPQPPLRGKLTVRREITGENWKFKDQGKLATDHCGGLTVRVASCWVYDYLGLFRRRVCKRVMGFVVVRPKPVPLERLPDFSRRVAWAWRPKRGGGFAENHELRLYRPGDNLQQIHWKLTAKTGKPILREAMAAEQSRMLISLDLRGTPAELDDMLGKLLWLSGKLLAAELVHEIHALTGKGIVSYRVADEADLQTVLDKLVWEPPAETGTIQDRKLAVSWEYYLGGGTDENG